MTADQTVILPNGTRLFIDPDDHDLLRFAWGTCLQQAGTSLYTYDHADASLTTLWHYYGGFQSILVSPADPEFLYLGLGGSGNPNGPGCE